jgi:hypothetical protein
VLGLCPNREGGAGLKPELAQCLGTRHHWVPVHLRKVRGRQLEQAGQGGEGQRTELRPGWAGENGQEAGEGLGWFPHPVPGNVQCPGEFAKPGLIWFAVGLRKLGLRLGLLALIMGGQACGFWVPHGLEARP